MTFQIQALEPEPFEHLFRMSDAELAAQGAKRVVADAPCSYPCRVSLADADIGATLILCNYKHLEINSPYAAAYAVFVREGAQQAQLEPGEVPELLRHRLLSLRGFDEAGYLKQADVVEGKSVARAMETMFENDDIAFVDIHNAREGCFHARAVRA